MAELNREGIVVARCTVERLMRELGIAGAGGPGGSGRGRRCLAGPASERPSDLLERDFTAPAPNRRWVADITYVETSGGFVYTAFILDLFARRRSSAGRSPITLRAELALDALEMAIWSRGDEIDGTWSIIPIAAFSIPSIRYTEAARRDKRGPLGREQGRLL